MLFEIHQNQKGFLLGVIFSDLVGGGNGKTLLLFSNKGRPKYHEAHNLGFRHGHSTSMNTLATKFCPLATSTTCSSAQSWLLLAEFGRAVEKQRKLWLNSRIPESGEEFFEAKRKILGLWDPSGSTIRNYSGRPRPSSAPWGVICILIGCLHNMSS